MDDLVQRLLTLSGQLSRDAQSCGYSAVNGVTMDVHEEAVQDWAVRAASTAGHALDVFDAARHLASLTAALEGLVQALENTGWPEPDPPLTAARAALREVGRG